MSHKITIDYMKSLILPFLLLLLTACSRQLYRTQILPPEFPVVDSQKKIVLIDKSALTTTGIIRLKKKARIVSQIKKDFLRQIATTMRHGAGVKVVFDTTVSTDSVIDTNSHAGPISRDTILQLMRQNNAAYLLVLKSFSQGFDRDRIEKTRDNKGVVTKTAYYSIFCSSEVEIYDSTGKAVTRKLFSSRDFTDQTIASALLDVGPSFEAHKDALTSMALLNAAEIAQLFYEKQLQIPIKKSELREVAGNP